MKIIEVAFTAYAVTDMRRARRFYEETLSLTPARSFGDADRGFVEYDIGSATLGIGNGADAIKPSKDGGMIVLEVEDFDAAIARLREHRVPFLFEPFETPVCRGVAISDPDGNSIMIHKRSSR